MSLNFVKYTKLYFAISALVLIPGIISIFLYGLKPSIDFTGGSLLELQFDNHNSISQQQLTTIVQDTLPASSIQPTASTFIIRAKQISNQQNQQIQTLLSQQFGSTTEVRFETVGPVLGEELLNKTMFAALIATAAILLYIAYRFQNIKYGVSAVVAMLHDTLIVIGVFSILGHYYSVEIDTLFVTAVLTILSFSVHDTIVVYDRIRESLHLHPNASFKQIINKSITETLSRSINNSMTIIFMLTALFLLGGDSIRWFVFALLIGTITGTYSSTFTAAPLLIVWENFKPKKN